MAKLVFFLPGNYWRKPFYDVFILYWLLMDVELDCSSALVLFKKWCLPLRSYDPWNSERMSKLGTCFLSLFFLRAGSDDVGTILCVLLPSLSIAVTTPLSLMLILPWALSPSWFTIGSRSILFVLGLFNYSYVIILGFLLIICSNIKLFPAIVAGNLARLL